MATYLKLTILVPNAQIPFVTGRLWEESIATDVLEWIHSDESPLAGEPDTAVNVGWINESVERVPPVRFWKQCSSYAAEISGDAIEEVER